MILLPCPQVIPNYSQQLVVGGDGVKMCPVGLSANIIVVSSAGKCSDYIFEVRSPGGELLPLHYLPSTINKMEVEYTPVEVGAHHAHVLLDRQPVVGSPFTCNVYDVAGVVVTGLEGTRSISKAITFTVDASDAGEGTLEIEVTTHKSPVKAEVVVRGRRLYDVTFVPQDTIPHFVNVYLNGDGIPNNPFCCHLAEDSDKSKSSDDEDFNPNKLEVKDAKEKVDEDPGVTVGDSEGGEEAFGSDNEAKREAEAEDKKAERKASSATARSPRGDSKVMVGSAINCFNLLMTFKSGGLTYIMMCQSILLF